MPLSLLPLPTPHLQNPPPKKNTTATHLAVLDRASRDLLHLGVVLDVALTLTTTHVTRNSLHSIQRQLL